MKHTAYLDRVLQALAPHPLVLLGASAFLQASCQGRGACHLGVRPQGRGQEVGLLPRMERVRLACLGLQAWGELRGLVGMGLGPRLGGHLVLLDMRWLLGGMVHLEEVLRLHLAQLLASRRDPLLN